jgi:hypothetical protein
MGRFKNVTEFHNGRLAPLIIEDLRLKCLSCWSGKSEVLRQATQSFNFLNQTG